MSYPFDPEEMPVPSRCEGNDEWRIIWKFRKERPSGFCLKLYQTIVYQLRDKMSTCILRCKHNIFYCLFDVARLPIIV